MSEVIQDAMTMTSPAHEFALDVLSHIKQDRPNLSLFEVLQALGAASAILIEEVLDAVATVDTDGKATVHTEAEGMTQRILAHMDAVRTEKQTLPAVDMLVSANLLVYLGIVYETEKVKMLLNAAKQGEQALIE